MSKKPDTASALAGILKAKRGDDSVRRTATRWLPRVPNSKHRYPPPLPCRLLPAPAATSAALEGPALKARGGKSSDPKYSQYSVYLRKVPAKRSAGHWMTTRRDRISANWWKNFWRNGLRHVPEHSSTQVLRHLGT